MGSNPCCCPCFWGMERGRCALPCCVMVHPATACTNMREHDTHICRSAWVLAPCWGACVQAYVHCIACVVSERASASVWTLAEHRSPLHMHFACRWSIWRAGPCMSPRGGSSRGPHHATGPRHPRWRRHTQGLALVTRPQLSLVVQPRPHAVEGQTTSRTGSASHAALIRMAGQPELSPRGCLSCDACSRPPRTHSRITSWIRARWGWVGGWGGSWGPKVGDLVPYMNRAFGDLFLRRIVTCAPHPNLT